MSQLDRSAAASFALRRRRAYRHQEWTEQKRLAALLDRHLDPATTFWTALENKPMSARIGMIQRQRGCRSGLPDIAVLHQGHLIFIELKSRAGVASKVQKQVALELVAAGATFWLARSARAAMTALVRSGVTFRLRWKAPDVLRPFEGPFADLTRRLPEALEVKARRRAAVRRYRARRRAREAAALTALATEQGLPHQQAASGSGSGSGAG